MQKVRIALRGKAVVVMGKNTLIRKIMRDMVEGEADKYAKLESLIPLIVGNMGFVFTNDNLNDVRKIILTSKVMIDMRHARHLCLSLFSSLSFFAGTKDAAESS